MSTAVLIVNYRGYDDLERCLGSLEPYLGLDDEVVIVDWESDRKALRRAAGRWPRAEVVPRGDNRGFAAGVNLAAARSRAPFLLLLNPDAVVESPVVRALEDWLTNHPDVGVAGARILDADGTLQQSARRFPDLTTWFGGRSTWLTSRFPGNWLTKRNLVAANAAASGQPVDRPAPPVAFPFDPRRGVRPRGGARRGHCVLICHVAPGAVSVRAARLALFLRLLLA